VAKTKSTVAPKKVMQHKKRRNGEMKKLVLCLSILALMALPAMATDNWPSVPTDGSNVGIDVQAYVDGSASYQAGCVDQQSCEFGIKDVCDVSSAGKITNFNCQASVPATETKTEICLVPPKMTVDCKPVDSDCGLKLTQSKWDTSCTVTQTCSVFKEDVDSKYAVGSANMNSLGGVAICSVPTGVNGSASVSNSHTIDQSATTGSLCSPCYANASYFGTQTLNVQAVKP
jgi:hypothetical protein